MVIDPFRIETKQNPLENVLVIVAVVVPNENLVFTLIVKAGKTVPVVYQDGLCLSIGLITTTSQSCAKTSKS